MSPIKPELPHPSQTGFATTHPKAFLALEGAVGAMLAIGSLWAFVAIADAFREKGALAGYDLVVEAWLQRVGTESGESIFVVVSWFGSWVLAAVLLVVIAMFLARQDWVRAAAVASAGGGATVLNYGLKALFHRGRPEYAVEFIHGSSWSFPSGHAMGSLAGYGFLVYLLLERTTNASHRRLLIGATVVFVGTIGFSRMYLGVHYLSDVIGGYLAGLVWLVVCVAGYRFATRRFAPR